MIRPMPRNRSDKPVIGKYPPNRLREIRQEEGLSRARLAQMCVPPTTVPTLEKLENRKMELTVTWMYRLGDAMQVNPAEFMLDTPRPMPSREETRMLELYRGLGEPARRRAFRVLMRCRNRSPTARPGTGRYPIISKMDIFC